MGIGGLNLLGEVVLFESSTEVTLHSFFGAEGHTESSDFSGEFSLLFFPIAFHSKDISFIESFLTDDKSCLKHK